MLEQIIPHCKKLEETIKEQSDKIIALENQIKKAEIEKEMMVKTFNYTKGAYDAYKQVEMTLEQNKSKEIIDPENA